MKILLFEWLTGGGKWIEDQSAQSSPDPISGEGEPSPQSGMSRQGHAMLSAITTDFLDAGIEVVTLIDHRDQFLDHVKLKKIEISSADDLKTKLVDTASKVNHVMLIAPESNGRLTDCIDWLGSSQHKLISPDAEFAKFASCKQSTVLRLQAGDFDLFPQGVLLSHFLAGTKRFDHPGPVVLKPTDGAGSENVHLITEWDNSKCQNSAPFAEQRKSLLAPLEHVWQHAPERFRIESFVSGTPVSVSVLCGARDSQILAPTIQVFDKEPFGEYVKAEVNVDPDISLRAIQLATKVVNVLPPTRGYIGLDLVISDQSSEQDVLIEINPRLTMSYLQLREIYPDLATSMFKKAVEGKRKS